MPERKNTLISKIKQLYKSENRLTQEEIEAGLKDSFNIALSRQEMNRKLWKFVNHTHQLVKIEECGNVYYRLTTRIIKDPVHRTIYQTKAANPLRFTKFNSIKAGPEG